MAKKKIDICPGKAEDPPKLARVYEVPASKDIKVTLEDPADLTVDVYVSTSAVSIANLAAKQIEKGESAEWDAVDSVTYVWVANPDTARTAKVELEY